MPKSIRDVYDEKYNDELYDQKIFKVSYIYNYTNGSKRELGTYNYFMTLNRHIDVRYGRTKLIDLIDVRQIDLPDFTWRMNTSQYSRYYMNITALGSALGALIELGYADVNFRGFSQINGDPGPSQSHCNGYYGDFGYFCQDQSQTTIYLSQKETVGDIYGWRQLDEVRQNEFNNAFYKFKWLRFYSWGYDGKLLNHSDQLANHYHHLHTRRYQYVVPTVIYE